MGRVKDPAVALCCQEHVLVADNMHAGLVLAQCTLQR